MTLVRRNRLHDVSRDELRRELRSLQNQQDDAMASAETDGNVLIAT